MATTHELIIKGQVQHVGVRDHIKHIGIEFGIDGIVYNHAEGTVRIIANFESEKK